MKNWKQRALDCSGETKAVDGEYLLIALANRIGELMQMVRQLKERENETIDQHPTNLYRTPRDSPTTKGSSAGSGTTKN